MSDLIDRHFSNETGEFLFELSLSNMITIFECDIQLNPATLTQYKTMLKNGTQNSHDGHQHQHQPQQQAGGSLAGAGATTKEGSNGPANSSRHHHNNHQKAPSRSGSELISLETNYFTFGAFDWSLTIVPLVIPSSSNHHHQQQQQLQQENSSTSSSSSNNNLLAATGNKSLHSTINKQASIDKQNNRQSAHRMGQQQQQQAANNNNTLLEPVCRVYLNRLSGFDCLCRVRYRVILGHHQAGLGHQQSAEFVDSKVLDQISDSGGRIRGHQFKNTNVLKLISLRSSTNAAGQQQQQQHSAAAAAANTSHHHGHGPNKAGQSGQTSTSLDLRVHIEMFCSNTITECKVPIQRKANEAQVSNCSDRNKQAWCVEADAEGENVRLKLFFMDLQSVPRNHIRYISWIAYIVRRDSKSGALKESIAVENSPHSNYYLQDGIDMGTIMETDIPVKELNNLSSYLDPSGSELTVHIEWVDSLLLFSHLYNNYDALATIQRHQISKELDALQAEYEHLEDKYIKARKELNEFLCVGEKNNSVVGEQATNNNKLKSHARSLTNQGQALGKNQSSDKNRLELEDDEEGADEEDEEDYSLSPTESPSTSPSIVKQQYRSHNMTGKQQRATVEQLHQQQSTDGYNKVSNQQAAGGNYETTGQQLFKANLNRKRSSLVGTIGYQKETLQQVGSTANVLPAAAAAALGPGPAPEGIPMSHQERLKFSSSTPPSLLANNRRNVNLALQQQKTLPLAPNQLAPTGQTTIITTTTTTATNSQSTGAGQVAFVNNNSIQLAGNYNAGFVPRRRHLPQYPPQAGSGARQQLAANNSVQATKQDSFHNSQIAYQRAELEQQQMRANSATPVTFELNFPLEHQQTENIHLSASGRLINDAHQIGHLVQPFRFLPPPITNNASNSNSNSATSVQAEQQQQQQQLQTEVAQRLLPPPVRLVGAGPAGLLAKEPNNNDNITSHAHHAKDLFNQVEGAHQVERRIGAGHLGGPDAASGINNDNNNRSRYFVSKFYTHSNDSLMAGEAHFRQEPIAADYFNQHQHQLHHHHNPNQNHENHHQQHHLKQQSSGLFLAQKQQKFDNQADEEFLVSTTTTSNVIRGIDQDLEALYISSSEHLRNQSAIENNPNHCQAQQAAFPLAHDAHQLHLSSGARFGLLSSDSFRHQASSSMLQDELSSSPLPYGHSLLAAGAPGGGGPEAGFVGEQNKIMGLNHENNEPRSSLTELIAGNRLQMIPSMEQQLQEHQQLTNEPGGGGHRGMNQEIMLPANRAQNHY